MRKENIIDGVIGFVAAFVLFLVVPLIVFNGSWGLVGFEAVQSMFPALTTSIQGTLMVLCVVYVIFDCILFLIYRELPFYKKRHRQGTESFLFALGSFLVGAVLGYGAVLFLALFFFSAGGMSL